MLNPIEAIADFLVNGTDNCDDIEAATHLVTEFGFSTVSAIRLMEDYSKGLRKEALPSQDALYRLIEAYKPRIRCPQYEIVERATDRVIGVCRTYSDQRALQSYYYYHGYRKGLFARLAKE